METKVENLISGMVIIQDVFDRNNLLIAPKGTQITEHIIMHLLRLGIYKVNASDNWVHDKVINEFNETYTHTLENIKNTFQSVKSKQNIGISQFESIVEELLNKSEPCWSILPYMRVIEKKDEYTFHHSINVSILSMLMGKWLGYKREDIKLLGVSGILHDVGKVLIPIEILNKPGKLSSMEYTTMKEHTRLGFQLIRNSGIIDDTIRNVVLSHHERMDGSGYPFGLKGNQINQKSRIVAICDVYDAITSKRVYKDKENPLKGLKIIMDCSYNVLDPYLSRIFLDNVVRTYHGCKAVLNNGAVCKIIRIFPDNPAKPWVAIDERLYNLSEHSELEIVDIL